MNINEKSPKEQASKSKQIASDMPQAASDKHQTAPAIPRGSGRVTKKNKTKTACTFLSRAPVVGGYRSAREARTSKASSSKQKQVSANISK